MRRFCTVTAAWCLAALASGQDSEPVEPYPLEYWAQRAAISNVEVSPDGKHLALMKILSKDGNPIIEVYDATDLGKEPFRVDADPMEITFLGWMSDRVLLFGLRQKVRDLIDDFNQGVYKTKFNLLDIETRRMRTFDTERTGIVNLLPDEPDKVIIAVAPGPQPGGNARNVRSAFRPLAYYEFDLRNGNRKLLVRGKWSMGQIVFDGDGNPWLGRGFDEQANEYVTYHRKLGASGWTPIHRQHEDEFERFAVIGFDVDDRDKLYAIAHNGHDTQGLWLFDVDSGDMSALYRRSDVDIVGSISHSNPWAHPDRVVGTVYAKDKIHREYFTDEESAREGALQAQVAGFLPHAHNVGIGSRSRDGNTLVVSNTGPRDPGTYYLIKDGRLQTIGTTHPQLKSEALADVRYITYKARDGKSIPAYLTVPHGEPPFPLVVMPHGGPFATEVVVYDKWSQLLANNGYLVLQPQFRGSENYGMVFYKLAFENGGQGGYKMQDDKDDGALHLVKEGLADPERLAMFGWSYGGYAALVAASRTPQIYQCVVAGAAVSDPVMQQNYYRFEFDGAESETQIEMWLKSVSPMKEAAKVNVPILMVHGDVDQRVPPEHAKKYLRQLDEHGKEYKYVELEGADHFSDTLFYDHQLKFFDAMIGFLADDCGPGGL